MPSLKNILAGLLVTAAPAAFSSAQTSPMELLERGPHEVGFRVLDLTDHARALSDSFGERARPVQLWLWYPAEDSGDGESLTLGEYLRFGTGKIGEIGYTEARYEARIAEYEGAFRRILSPEQLGEALSRPMRAVKNAPESGGRFPLVMYASGAPGDASDNAPLLELIASHGYVVAGVGCLGLHGEQVRGALADMEATLGDLRYGLGVASRFDNVDPERVAAMGYSWGGWAAAWLDVMDARIDATMLHDAMPGLRFEWMTSWFESMSPEHSMRLDDTPVLDVMAGRKASMLPPVPVDERRAQSVFDESPYRSGSALVLEDMDHSGFASTTLVLFGHTKVEPGKRDRAFAAATAASLRFLDEHLRGGAPLTTESIKPTVERMAVPGPVHVDSKRGERRPPSGAEFVALVEAEGLKAGEAEFDRARGLDPAVQLFGPRELTVLGTAAFASGDVDGAADVIKLQIKAYPRILRNYMDLGFIYEQAGRTEELLETCRRMLKIDPEDPWALRRVSGD
ncbi:MAG: hypothetical protein ED559_05210 [Phycisphaera sp.]|nr:MAG: hypothetical protein ED559_05210 [Phycisphaera sp.]